MCQHMNRSAGDAACARASDGVRSDSSIGSEMQAAAPRSIARRVTNGRGGLRLSASSAFRSKLTFPS
jgi:hypothetical protein